MTQRRGGSDLIGGISTLFEDVSETGVGGPPAVPLLCRRGSSESGRNKHVYRLRHGGQRSDQFVSDCWRVE